MYKTIAPEIKWTLLAMFNVMQFFLYNASTNDNSNLFYLKQFLHIFEKVAPKIVDISPELEQFVLGEATDLKSNDVIHTMVSILYVKQHMA